MQFKSGNTRQNYNGQDNANVLIDSEAFTITGGMNEIYGSL